VIISVETSAVGSGGKFTLPSQGKLNISVYLLNVQCHEINKISALELKFHSINLKGFEVHKIDWL
jgi:hypothetical protein